MFKLEPYASAALDMDKLANIEWFKPLSELTIHDNKENIAWLVRVIYNRLEKKEVAVTQSEFDERYSVIANPLARVWFSSVLGDINADRLLKHYPYANETIDDLLYEMSRLRFTPNTIVYLKTIKETLINPILEYHNKCTSLTNTIVYAENINGTAKLVKTEEGIQPVAVKLDFEDRGNADDTVIKLKTITLPPALTLKARTLMKLLDSTPMLMTQDLTRMYFNACKEIETNTNQKFYCFNQSFYISI